MLERNKNIDNLFKTSLESFSDAPPLSVWSTVEKDLDAEKQEKRVFLFWRSLAAAAVLFVIGSSLIILFNQTNTETNKIVSSFHTKHETHTPNNTPENTSNQTSTELPLSQTQNEAIAYEHIVAPPNIQNTFLKYSAEDELIVTTNPTQKLSLLHGKGLPLLASTHSDLSTQLKSKPHSYYTFYPEIIPPTSNAKTKSTHILLGGSISPSYSSNGANNGISSGDMYADATSNSYSQTSADINEKGLTSISGGLNIRFENETRWSVETGFHYSKIGETVQNSFSYSPNKLSSGSNETHILQHVSLNNSIGQINLKDNVLNDTKTTINNDLPYLTNAYTNSTAETKQTLEYIEIPLSVRYKIFTGYPTISIAGGISSNFLIGNNAYLIDGKSETKIGETGNIKPLVFSSSLGLGLELPLGKSFRFSLEPKLKYFLNSVNSDSNYSYQPVSLGIFGGIILIVN